MTFRGYHARLIAVTQNRLRAQREMSLSVLMGIAGAFGGGKKQKKGEGFEAILKGVEGHINELDDAIVEVFGGRHSAKELLAELGDLDQEQAAVSAAAAQVKMQQARQAQQAVRSVADVQRDIRKLDVIMSNLTGTVVRNPMAGYGQGQGPSPYTLGRMSVKDQLGRV